MTLFEYMAIAVTVVLALSAVQTLASLRSIFQPQRRYWVHALWVVHLLLMHVILWWEIWVYLWAYPHIESWNLVVFGLVLLNPCLLVVCTYALVFRRHSDETSWEQHFFSVRKWFFMVRGLIVVVSTLVFSLFLSIPILDPAQLPGLLMLFVCVVGVLYASRRVHGPLVLISLVDVILGTFYLWMW